MPMTKEGEADGAFGSVRSGNYVPQHADDRGEQGGAIDV